MISSAIYPRLLLGLVFGLISLLSTFPGEALATPTQFGDTGLLSQPTAQTLNEGNICVGLWANCYGGVASGPGTQSDGLIIPVTITMGLGTFLETFGSYPNLSFNGDEDNSGRGAASAGFKFRLFGKRSDAFRLGWDISARRTISEDAELDGLTDYVSHAIASYKAGTLGFHANAGYAHNESPDSIDYEDQVLFGGGVEYFPANRLRLLSEFSYETEKVSGQDGPSEVTVGFQYFLTPHLTMNLGAGLGLSDTSPDWRAIFGFSTCQGVGTFNRPVPKLVEPEEALEEAPAEPVKPVKIRILTPLIPKATVAESPVSDLEVPLTERDQAVLVDPGDRLETPQVAKLEVSALSPIGGREVATDAGLPHEPFSAKVVRKFRFPEFVFAFNQWDLSEEGERAFTKVAEELRKEDRYFIISIEGHTDDIGPERYNMNLSFRRAVTAATHLVLRNGIDPARIFVKAFGEARPIASNDSRDGRAKNRRVELLVLIPEGYDQGRVERSAARSARPRPDKAAGHAEDVPANDRPRAESPAVTNLREPAPVDALSIEQAISEKTGAATIPPSGAFSRAEAGAPGK